MVADAADQAPEAARLGALRIRPHLDALLAGLDNQRHLAADPLAFVYRFASPQDREVIAFFAALLAYGRVDLIRRALTDVVARVGPTPAATAAAEDLPAARQRFDGFVYRLTRGEDLARLWAGIGHLLRRHGSLLAAFQAGDDGQGDLRAALTRFHRAFNEPLAAEAPRQAYKHLLPDPAGPSPVKRLNLLLRWLVRGPDAIDLGLWRVLGPARLTIPLDTHVHRISRYLGLTTRTQADHRTAAEITTALRALDPADPLRYDFALAHLGISGACPSRRVEAICVSCPLEPICRLDAEGRPLR